MRWSSLLQPKFIPLRFKIILSVMVLITMVVGIITFTMANLFHADKKTYINDLTSMIAVYSAEETNSILNNYYNRLQMIRWVIQNSDLDQETRARLLKGFLEDFDASVGVVLYIPGAEPVMMYDAKAMEQAGISKAQLQEFRRQHPLPTAQVLTGQPYVRNARISERVPIFSMAVRWPEEGSHPAMVIEAFIRLEEILNITSRSGMFEIFLMDSEGNLLAHSDPAKVKARTVDWFPIETLERLKPISEGKSAAMTLEYDDGKRDMLAGFARVDLAKLILGAQVPKTIAYLGAKEFLNYLTGVALILLISATLLGLLWARRITQPLESLSQAAHKLGKGQFDIKVATSTTDELGTLAGSFNQMGQELKSRDDALKVAQAALVQSEKMSAFGQLSAGIAHEVKNPLAGILGYAQLSLRKIEQDHPLYRNLSLIEKETKRTKAIIENLMRFARQEKVAHEPMDLNKVVEDAISIVDHQLTINQISIKKELTSPLPLIKGNANQIQQVLMNLMINAQQAMEGKPGEVTVTTRQCDPAHVEVVVSDNGPGIAQELQIKIFEPFFTTKPAGKGTGLGLSVSYGIIKDHHGEIRLVSSPGQGAAFIITFPVVQAYDAHTPYTQVLSQG